MASAEAPSTRLEAAMSENQNTQNGAKDSSDSPEEQKASKPETRADSTVEQEASASPDKERTETSTEGSLDFDNMSPLPMPVVENWKTSISFSILGAVVYLVIWVIIARIIETSLMPSDYSGVPLWSFSDFVQDAAISITALIFFAITIVYAGVFYPSYFKEKPIVKSNKIISMLNVGIGGVIFGPYWNSILTISRSEKKCRKGYSHIVAIVCCTISILFVDYTLLTTQLPALDDVNQYIKHVDAANPRGITSSVSNKKQTFTDSELGISFKVPSNWESNNASKSDGDEIRCTYTVDDGYVRFTLIAWDDYERNESIYQKRNISRSDINTLSAIDKDRAMDLVSSNIDSVTDSTAEMVSINGKDCWLARAKGTVTSSTGKQFSAAETDYYLVDNGTVYYFILESRDYSDKANDQLANAMEQIVSSVEYDQ